jgi:hypothetical protein
LSKANASKGYRTIFQKGYLGYLQNMVKNFGGIFSRARHARA